MGKVVLVLRILLGLVFTVFGLNGFLNFLEPPAMPQEAQNFMGALVNTGYLLTVVKAVEVFCGVLLLIGRWVPFALVILGPVVVNIFLFHIFLAPDPSSGLIGYLSFLIWLFLGWVYRSSYSGLLAADAKPTV